MRTTPRLLSAVLAAAAALLVAGCGEKSEPALEDIEPPSTPGLSVVLEPTSVAPGGQLEARVLNETDERFVYGLDYSLERQGPNGFQPVQLPDRPVIQKGLIAEPGEQGPPVRVDVPPQAEPGTWRVVLQRDIPGGGILAGEFEVRGG